MNIDSLTQILTILLGVMIFILMLLSIIFLVLKTKENKISNLKAKFAVKIICFYLFSYTFPP